MITEKIGVHTFSADWDFVIAGEMDSVFGADTAIDSTRKAPKFVNYCCPPCVTFV